MILKIVLIDYDTVGRRPEAPDETAGLRRTEFFSRAS
jgi:hypothetical protein